MVKHLSGSGEALGSIPESRYKKKIPRIVVCAYNPSAREAEARGVLVSPDQPDGQTGKLQTTVNPYLKSKV